MNSRQRRKQTRSLVREISHRVRLPWAYRMLSQPRVMSLWQIEGLDGLFVETIASDLVAVKAITLGVTLFNPAPPEMIRSYADACLREHESRVVTLQSHPRWLYTPAVPYP